jgi:L-aspartate oxidase
VRTDLNGRTSLPGLYAAGEAACTGVHGANRLASNSLLEGVVFGARAGRAMRETDSGWSTPAPFQRETDPPGSLTCDDIRRLAWEHCGVIRSGEGLREACRRLENQGGRNREAANLRLVALLIARCALAREESRGAHFRTDFPEKRERFASHSSIRAGEGPGFGQGRPQQAVQ